MFLGGSQSIGIWITPWVARGLTGAGIHNVKLLAGRIFAFFLAWPASGAGLAAIVGAFAAGVILNDSFVPLFFVWKGIQVKLEALASKDVLIVGAALTAVAMSEYSERVRMSDANESPGRWIRDDARGEVGSIFAGWGKGIGVVDDRLFSAVILLVMVTTLLTPLALQQTC